MEAEQMRTESGIKTTYPMLKKKGAACKLSVEITINEYDSLNWLYLNYCNNPYGLWLLRVIFQISFPKSDVMLYNMVKLTNTSVIFVIGSRQSSVKSQFLFFLMEERESFKGKCICIENTIEGTKNYELQFDASGTVCHSNIIGEKLIKETISS